MMYQVCESCGSHLDHSETCDCKTVQAEEKANRKDALKGMEKQLQAEGMAKHAI